MSKLLFGKRIYFFDMYPILFYNKFILLVGRIKGFVGNRKVLAMRKVNWKIKDMVGILLLCSGAYILFRMIGFGLSEDIWYDEVFSAGMMRYSYKEIVEFTAKDVHPPFYYWYLKTVADMGSLLLKQTDPIVFAKLASVFPMMGLWTLAITYVRKIFGLFTAGMFVFCTFSMPQLAVYGVEIRMYSLALLLVTMAYFFGYEIYRTKNRKAFIGLFITGILTAYTQYFSCIMIVILYLLVGLAVRKDSELRKKWWLNIVASILCYLPWLGILISQFTTVNSSYWIPPLTWKSLLGCIKYIYLPSGGYPMLNTIMAVAMILATMLLAVIYFCKRGSLLNWFEEEGFLVLLSWGILGGLIVIGVSVSILLSPIFVYRYMIPCLGAYWFVYGMLLDKCHRKWVWLLITIMTVLVGITNIKGIFWEENHKVTQMQETREGLGKIQEEDVLIYNFNHVQATVGYYKNNDSYLLYQEAEELIQEIYREYGMIEEADQIKDLLKRGRKVWFLGSFHSREDIVKEWEQQGLKVTEVGSYLLERYWFNLYSVE